MAIKTKSKSAVKRVAKTFELEADKRLHLPFVVTSCCPKCGVEMKVDLRKNDYLSYPTIGESSKVYFGHDDCEAEWQVEVVLDVTLVVK